MKVNRKPAILPRERHAGMTLVEVLVALLLISFGLSSFLVAFTAAARTTEASIRRTQALHMARRAMEDIRTRSYTSVPLGTSTYTTGVTYTVSTASGFVTTKNIRLAVNWNNPGDNQVRQIILWSSMASCIHP